MKSVFREDTLKLVGLIIIGGIVGAILAVLLPAGPLLGPMVGIGGTLIVALVACFVLEKLTDCFNGFVRFEKSEELDNYQSIFGTVDLNVIRGFCEGLESMGSESGFKDIPLL